MSDAATSATSAAPPHRAGIFRPIRTRIRHKITLAVILAITIAMGINETLHSWLQERSALQERERSLTVLTNSISQGIEAIMLAGSTEATVSFTNHFKDVPYIRDFRIVRYDGKEAFSDNRTIDQVNMTLEKGRYERREQEAGTRILPEDDARLVQALETNDIVSYYEESAGGERLLTFLAPIRTSPDCRECHSSKKTRGVIQLSTSLSAIDESLTASRRNSLLALLGTIIVTTLIAGQLLRRWVSGPLERLTGAIRSISQGDLEQSVKVVGHDEFGEMARIFNVMSNEIRMTHAGLRREQDKLTTIILGAEEGIIVTDGDGKVVLVNPAAERLLGKSALQIMHAGFMELFDDAAEMDRWLKQMGTEPIVKLYNTHLFQVYVSTIQDGSGAVIGTAALLRDVTEEKRLEEELRRLSTTDALTGLYNRRHMEYVLTTEHSRSGRTKAPFAVLMFDIDHFKKFNDTYGHEQGDRVLQAVARAFRDSLRKYDTACRYGGEEFIGILPQTTLDGGVSVAERLRSEVERLVVDGLKVTISIGVAAYPETGIEAVDQLIHEADKALYRAKEHGRNRVMCAGSSA